MIKNVLIEHVVDADFHTKYSDIRHSTNLREIVTVGDMIDHAEKREKTD